MQKRSERRVRATLRWVVASHFIVQPFSACFAWFMSAIQRENVLTFNFIFLLSSVRIALSLHCMRRARPGPVIHSLCAQDVICDERLDLSLFSLLFTLIVITHWMRMHCVWTAHPGRLQPLLLYVDRAMCGTLGFEPLLPSLQICRFLGLRLKLRHWAKSAFSSGMSFVSS